MNTTFLHWKLLWRRPIPSGQKKETINNALFFGNKIFFVCHFPQDSTIIRGRMMSWTNLSHQCLRSVNKPSFPLSSIFGGKILFPKKSALFIVSFFWPDGMGLLQSNFQCKKVVFIEFPILNEITHLFLFHQSSNAEKSLFLPKSSSAVPQ
jgi:hypothetical protein